MRYGICFAGLLFRMFYKNDINGFGFETEHFFVLLGKVILHVGNVQFSRCVHDLREDYHTFGVLNFSDVKLLETYSWPSSCAFKRSGASGRNGSIPASLYFASSFLIS